MVDLPQSSEAKANILQTQMEYPRIYICITLAAIVSRDREVIYHTLVSEQTDKNTNLGTNHSDCVNGQGYQLKS